MSYYDDNAKEYIEKTINCDMQTQYDMVLEFIHNGALLDVGFGSARDMLYFRNKGFDVYGIDPTEGFCAHARELGFDVVQSTIENYKTDKKYDTIWACASLLHSKDMKKAFLCCYDLLNPHGILYVSLKIGRNEEFVDGRYFHYIKKEELDEIVKACGFEILKESITNDSLASRNVSWLNAVLKKSSY